MNSFEYFEIAMLIREIYSNTMNIISKGLRDSGLTHQQIMIMKLIAHNGQINISRICDEMSLAKGTVSGIVQRLESAGYIQKVKYEEDKRNTYVKLSSKGIAFANEFKNKMNESFEKVFRNFTDEEIINTKEELKKIKSKLDVKD